MIDKKIIRTEKGVVVIKFNLKTKMGMAAVDQGAVGEVDELLVGFKVKETSFSGRRYRASFSVPILKNYYSFLKKNNAEDIQGLGRMLWEEPKK